MCVCVRERERGYRVMGVWHLSMTQLNQARALPITLFSPYTLGRWTPTTGRYRRGWVERDGLEGGWIGMV